MIIPTVDGWDATRDGLSGVPGGQGAGNTTGSPGIRWTDPDWHAHAGAVRICQDDGLTDHTADIADVERYAGTPAQAWAWYREALDSWKDGTRPGQRHPAVYCSPDTLPALSQTWRSHSDDVMPWVWLARWGIGLGGARYAVGGQGGGFYRIAIQYAHGGRYDSDVFSRQWLDDVSGRPAPPPPPPSEGWTARMLEELPTLKQGDKGRHVRTAQGLLVARHYHLGATGKAHDGIDGDYGPLTDAAVRDIQGANGKTEDGITGPETWPLLAGV